MNKSVYMFLGGMISIFIKISQNESQNWLAPFLFRLMCVCVFGRLMFFTLQTIFSSWNLLKSHPPHQNKKKIQSTNPKKENKKEKKTNKYL